MLKRKSEIKQKMTLNSNFFIAMVEGLWVNTYKVKIAELSIGYFIMLFILSLLNLGKR